MDFVGQVAQTDAEYVVRLERERGGRVIQELHGWRIAIKREGIDIPILIDDRDMLVRGAKNDAGCAVIGRLNIADPIEVVTPGGSCAAPVPSECCRLRPYSGQRNERCP